MDFEKLNNATEQVKTGLKKEFPTIKFGFQPHYCGMGYCGIKIYVSEKDMTNNVTKYYDQHFEKIFFQRIITHEESKGHDETSLEVFIVDEKGESHKALPILKSVYEKPTTEQAMVDHHDCSGSFSDYSTEEDD